MDSISFDQESIEAIKAGTKTITRRPYKYLHARYQAGMEYWAKISEATTEDTSPFHVLIRLHDSEHLQQITPQEVEAEGIDVVSHLPMVMPRTVDVDKLVEKIAKQLFAERWDKIYGQTKWSWENNPFVEVLCFDVINKAGGAQ